MSNQKQARKQAIAKAKLSISKLSIISRNVNMVNQKINSILSSSPEIDDTKSISYIQTGNFGVKTLDDIDTFNQKYKLGKKIGQGSSGVVWECLHIRRNKIYACKTIMFDDEHVPLLKKSFRDVRQLEHTGIIKYKALYLDLQKHLAYLVMQYVDLPNLMKYISNIRHSIQQHDVKWIFEQLFKTLEYMHSKGLCHRDIKPDNIMINEQTKKIKLIDFGIAKKMFVRKQKIDMLTITGTLYYRAPQMFLGGGYNQKVDIWGAGITLYQVLYGKTPFASEYHSQTIENIQTVELQNQQDDDEKSQLVKDLLHRLLRKNPTQRFTAHEALEHLWFEKKPPKLRIQQRYSDIGHFIQTEYSKFKKTAVQYDPNIIKNYKTSHLIRKDESSTYHRMEVDDF